MIGSILRMLANDREASTGILVASGFPVLLCSSAMAIDLGSLYLAERKLQSVADAAALAAARGDIEREGMSQAQLMVARSGLDNVRIEAFTPGQYHQDKSRHFSERFEADGDEPTAASLVLEQTVPLFFASFLNEKSGQVKVKAVASRLDVTAFSLGTALAEVSGGLPNQILSQLAGTELSLSLLDTRRLAGAEIDLLNFADALKLEIGAGKSKTYGEVFDTEIPLYRIIEAMAASAEGAERSLLLTIARQLGDDVLRLSDIIDLGPIGQTDVTDGNSGITIDAYSLMRKILELAQGGHYDIELDVGIPGCWAVMSA